MTRPAPEPAAEPERPAAPSKPAPATAAPIAAQAAQRTLPRIPEGPDGDHWFAHTANLASTHPNFTQQARSTVFLDTHTGVLVHRDQTFRIDLPTASAAEILNTVFHALPGGVERIYITAGAPWHRQADQHPFLKDTVAAWLNAPTPGWRTDTGRGKDKMAGHFVHPATPSAATSANTATSMSRSGPQGSGSTPTAPSPPSSVTRSSCSGRPCAATGPTPS